MSFQTPSVTRRQLVQGVALLGCSLAAAPMARAAIVNIDVSTFNGVNAGMSYGAANQTVLDFVPGGDLKLRFNGTYIGLNPTGFRTATWVQFAYNGGYADPHNFAAGDDVSTWNPGDWADSPERVAFYASNYSAVSPNFGPGSFIGVRFSSNAVDWNYGWLEVTWNWTGNPQTSSFQILGGAYESNLNTAILAGASAGGGGVPLPGAAGLAACGLLGLGRRRRR